MGVHPGSFCSPPGGTGETVTGVPMVCSPKKTGDRARWRRNGPAPARTPRARGRRPAAGSGGATLPVVNTGIDPTKPAEAPAPADKETTNTTPQDKPDQATTMPPRTDEPIEPPNGGWDIDQGLMHFDGAFGRLWNDLRDDRHLQVDGHALGNVVKDLGEGITMRKHSSAQALDELRRIRRQVPDGSQPARLMDWTINRLHAPDRPEPALPDNAPPQLRKLMTALNSIPLVRRGRDDGFPMSSDGTHETDELAAAAHEWAAGRMPRFRFQDSIRDVARIRHESMEGWTEIREAVATALQDFHQWGRRPS